MAPADLHIDPRTFSAPHAANRAPRYDRERDLPRLIQLWPHEIASRDPATLGIIVRRLHAALRAERQRGLAGHWTYDLARHTQLLAAYRAESQRIKAKRPRRKAGAMHEPECTDAKRAKRS